MKSCTLNLMLNDALNELPKTGTAFITVVHTSDPGSLGVF